MRLNLYQQLPQARKAMLSKNVVPTSGDVRAMIRKRAGSAAYHHAAKRLKLPPGPSSLRAVSRITGPIDAIPKVSMGSMWAGAAGGGEGARRWGVGGEGIGGGGKGEGIGCTGEGGGAHRKTHSPSGKTYPISSVERAG